MTTGAPAVARHGAVGALHFFRYPLIASAAGLALAFALGGPAVAGIVAILIVLEVSLSFDNAVVNATVLERMDERWRRIFLTVGIVIAVFGMRLVFPILVVAIAGHMGPGRVVDLALNHPGQYADALHAAHPAIAAFGGVFLLMIFLDFLFEEREITWLGPIERPLARIGKLDQLSVLVALVLLVVASKTFAEAHSGQVLVAGICGLATYVAVGGLAALFESSEEDDAPSDGTELRRNVARAGLFSFLYLEVLDASFSFDGVVGAFSVTNNVLVISLGLGIGACYIRTMTVFLVERGTFKEYAHLEHGAHWAIGALAVLLLVTITHEVPELVSGGIGVGFIAAALATSIARNRRLALDEAAAGDGDVALPSQRGEQAAAARIGEPSR